MKYEQKVIARIFRVIGILILVYALTAIIPGLLFMRGMILTLLVGISGWIGAGLLLYFGAGFLSRLCIAAKDED